MVTSHSRIVVKDELEKRIEPCSLTFITTAIFFLTFEIETSYLHACAVVCVFVCDSFRPLIVALDNLFQEAFISHLSPTFGEFTNRVGLQYYRICRYGYFLQVSTQ